MRSIKSISHIVNLRFFLLITVFSLLTLVGCKKPPAPVPVFKGSGIGKEQPVEDVVDPATRKVIVLLHGLNCSGDPGIASLGSKLKQDIPNSEIIILNRNDSNSSPIYIQAIRTCQQIQAELVQKNATGWPVIIIGNSQGGILAVEIDNLCRNGSFPELDIVGLILNHAPLQGVPGLMASDAQIQALENAIGSSLFKAPNPSIKNLLLDNVNGDGGQDLKPGSFCIKRVQENLSQSETPVLAVAGSTNSVSAFLALAGSFGIPYVNRAGLVLSYFPPIGDYLRTIGAAFEDAIGGESDGLVPLSSQIADETITPLSFRRHVVPGYHHFADMPDGVYGTMLAFIKSCFNVPRT